MACASAKVSNALANHWEIESYRLTGIFEASPVIFLTAIMPKLLPHFMADHASGTIDFHLLFFCASRQPLFSAMSRTFLSALRLVVVAIVLAAVGGVCVDILPASAQQNEITTPDRQGVDEAAKLNNKLKTIFARSLCRRRAALQAVAGDQRESARSRSSRCRYVAEQSGGALQ